MRQYRPGREIYVEQGESNLQVNGKIDGARGKEAERDRKGGNENGNGGQGTGEKTDNSRQMGRGGKPESTRGNGSE